VQLHELLGQRQAKPLSISVWAAAYRCSGTVIAVPAGGS
jgi:hypothetical protein